MLILILDKECSEGDGCVPVKPACAALGPHAGPHLQACARGRGPWEHGDGKRKGTAEGQCEGQSECVRRTRGRGHPRPRARGCRRVTGSWEPRRHRRLLGEACAEDGRRGQKGRQGPHHLAFLGIAEELGFYSRSQGVRSRVCTMPVSHVLRVKEETMSLGFRKARKTPHTLYSSGETRKTLSKLEFLRISTAKKPTGPSLTRGSQTF